MTRNTILTAMVVAVAAATASAQDARVEISGTAGWTFSDGVNVGTIDESPEPWVEAGATWWLVRFDPFTVTVDEVRDALGRRPVTG